LRRSHEAVIRPTWPAADRRDHPRRLIGEHLAEAARTWPDDLAVVEGPHRLTYDELDERVERVGRSLRALGVARGDVVTVELPNWWETSVLIHAVLRIGGVPNPVVPIYRDREMSFIIAQARPRVVVARSHRALHPAPHRGGVGKTRESTVVARSRDSYPAPSPLGRSRGKNPGAEEAGS